jgi:hypothetical protein
MLERVGSLVLIQMAGASGALRRFLLIQAMFIVKASLRSNIEPHPIA